LLFFFALVFIVYPEKLNTFAKKQNNLKIVAKI